MSRPSPSLLYAVSVFAVASALALLTLTYTSGAPNLNDGAQNVRAAYNLVHLGVVSLNKQPSKTPEPQMRREPLPIWVTAGFLLINPAFAEPYTIADVETGRLAEAVKGVNAFWRLLAAVLIFLLCFELFIDKRVAFGAGVICNILSEFFFFRVRQISDRMYTELPESALMLLVAWCAVRFVRNESIARAITLGLALGLLALCKAAFLYIGLGFVVLLLLTRRSNRAHSAAAKPGWKNVLLTYGLILAAMALTIAPWIARNAVELGKPQIVSGTDASVLGTRMLLTEHSLLGQLYLYTPPTLKPGVGWLTGYTSKDLEPGGRLEAASKAKDERVAIFTQRMQAEQYLGARGPWLKDKALDYVVENPARYLASIPLFAYKGLWFLSGAGAVINLLAVLTFLCIFFAAVLARDRVLLAAFGLAAGLYFFIAIFTHALLRYNAPMTPFVVLSCLWLVGAGAHWANRRFDLERMLQRRSDAKSSTHRSPTTPTSSAETASRA